MCFSNLPIEFDDEGDPYLASEAETVERPTTETESAACDCDDATADIPLEDADPEEMYESILAGMPREARERLTAHRGRRVRAAERDRATSSDQTDRPTNP
ncbi:MULTISPECIES: hypothetical protein [Natrialbaceae]|uniref:hypothetical protein n=1 Tax=Natrialbaceae TaxID=1644061 RepID=UPI00207C33CC|nr:hypothetical protein [Natronococcus sp. CG52]